MTGAPAGTTGRTSNWRWLAGGVAILFGIATLVEGGQVLFGSPEAKAAAGNFVPFVLTFNFISGFLYITTGVATLAAQSWAVWLARLLAVAVLITSVALGVHVLQGGAYETRTAVAMAIRTAFWTAQALVLPTLLRRTGAVMKGGRSDARSAAA